VGQAGRAVTQARRHDRSADNSDYVNRPGALVARNTKWLVLEVLRGSSSQRDVNLVFPFVVIDPDEQVTQIVSGEPPTERPRSRVVALLEGLNRCSTSARSVKSLGDNTLRCTTEKKISTWFNQDACTGVCTITAFGNRAARRSIAALPRWEDPLST